MSVPSLRRAAALSLAVHLSFLSLFALSVRKPAMDVAPYIVTLVSFAAPETAPGTSGEKYSTVLDDGVGVDSPLKTTISTEAPDYLKDYKSKKMNALKAKREDRLYKTERLGAIRSNKGHGSRPTMAGGDYATMVEDLIRKGWVFPSAEGRNLNAVISITVLKTGVIKITGFEKSSGNPLFDRSALKAVTRASPLPQPPGEMEIGVRFFL